MRATDSSWRNPVAQLALSRVMAAGYLAVETVGLTKRATLGSTRMGGTCQRLTCRIPRGPKGSMFSPLDVNAMLELDEKRANGLGRLAKWSLSDSLSVAAIAAVSLAVQIHESI